MNVIKVRPCTNKLMPEHFKNNLQLLLYSKLNDLFVSGEYGISFTLNKNLI
jgi:hypothetical protein